MAFLNTSRPYRIVAIAAVVCLIAPTPAIWAQRAEYSEYQVKAAFLINFAKFTQWPDETFQHTDSFKIGILGDDPFGEEIDKVVEQERLKDKPIKILRSEDVADLKECHILFIAASERRRQEEIIKEIQDLSILTVGETEQHARLGGIVRFKIKGGRVRFDINVTAARKAKLRLSSKLLELATIVK